MPLIFYVLSRHISRLGRPPMQSYEFNNFMQIVSATSEAGDDTARDTEGEEKEGEGKLFPHYSPIYIVV